MVVWQGLRLVAASLVIGLGAALALARVLQGMFLGVTTNDPVVLAFGPLVLATAAAAAVWLPARRATAAAPMTAIRN
jgi:hypothetical protein